MTLTKILRNTALQGLLNRSIDYSGKAVVITGAGGLICGAMARAFAQSGAKVAALDLNENAVKELADSLKAEGFVCEGYKADVLDAAALENVGSTPKVVEKV